MTTTPGRMRMAGVGIVVGLLVLALIGTGSLRARHRAATAVGTQAEPLLVGAEQIYSSLADADATATNTFLSGGLEPADRRQSYLNDVATATDELAKVAAQAGSSTDAAHAVAVISKNLPTYSGLIESARVDNRLGYPVGAAYLREGSTLMQTAILPAVRQLYQVEAARLDNAYHSGQSLLDVIGVLLAGALALAVLLVTQAFLARRTNRTLNVPLVGGSVILVALLAWTFIAFAASATRLHDARSRGSDPVQFSRRPASWWPGPRWTRTWPWWPGAAAASTWPTSTLSPPPSGLPAAPRACSIRPSRRCPGRPPRSPGRAACTTPTSRPTPRSKRRWRTGSSPWP
jgi:hypothetical protein